MFSRVATAPNPEALHHHTHHGGLGQRPGARSHTGGGVEIDAHLDVDSITAAVRSCPGVAAISTVNAPTSTDPNPDDLGPVSIAYDPHTIDIAVLAFYGPRPPRWWTDRAGGLSTDPTADT